MRSSAYIPALLFSRFLALNAASQLYSRCLSLADTELFVFSKWRFSGAELGEGLGQPFPVK